MHDWSVFEQLVGDGGAVRSYQRPKSVDLDTKV